jgi:hypothetical protein
MEKHEPDTVRVSEVVSEGHPVVEPDLDWDDQGIDASGDRNPLSGSETVLKKLPGD